jgi:ketosteroid isomerase-like protein
MPSNKEIVAAFGAAWARRDLDAVMDFFDDDCVYAASVGPEPGTTFRGRQQVREGIAAMFAYDRDSQAEVGRMFAEGDSVFAEWIYRFPAESGWPPAHGCDVFEFAGGKIVRKEAFRKQHRSSASATWLPTYGSHEMYRPRWFDDLGIWTFGTKRFKLIGISYGAEHRQSNAAPELVAAAEAHCRALADQMDRQGGHFALGFVILHEGATANWLLFDWWLEGGILAHILSSSSLEQPARFRKVEPPLMACAWELLAIAHERDAWVTTMMSDFANPERYLAERIQPGLR